MNTQRSPTRFGEVLERLAQAGEEHERVTFGAMLEAIGRRSFGPLLLLPGLIALSPLSGIPGVPSSVALMVLLVIGQLLLGRKHFWLPQWLLRRGAPRDKFDRALHVLQPVARGVDRVVRPRLGALTYDWAIYVIALMCLLIALCMPLLELVPFAATTAGAALTAFGLSLTAHDGVLALVAVVFCVLSAALILHTLA